jgi:hypothetical protein
VRYPIKIKSESARLAIIFICSALTAHLGYLWEFLLKVFGLDNAGSAWLMVLLAQVAAFAVLGIVAAWTRWARAGWYMLGSFAAAGLVYYFATAYHQFAYISSALWYGLCTSAITYRSAKEQFSKNTPV